MANIYLEFNGWYVCTYLLKGTVVRFVYALCCCVCIWACPQTGSTGLTGGSGGGGCRSKNKRYAEGGCGTHQRGSAPHKLKHILIKLCWVFGGDADV